MKIPPFSGTVDRGEEEVAVEEAPPVGVHERAAVLLHVPGRAQPRSEVVLVAAEEARVVVAQPEVQGHAVAHLPGVLEVDPPVVVGRVHGQVLSGLGQGDEEPGRRLGEAETGEEVLVDGVGARREEGRRVLHVVQDVVEAVHGDVVVVPAELELVVAAPVRLAPCESLGELHALGGAVPLSVEGGGRLLEAAREQDEDRFEAALAVDVVAEPALQPGGRGLQEGVGIHEEGVAQDARVGGAGHAGGGAGKGEGAEDGRADLAPHVLVAAVGLHEDALLRSEVDVELDHPVEAIRVGGNAEVLDAPGGGEALGHEGRDLRAVDVHPARLVQLLEGAEEERLVLHDGPPHGGAPLVALQLGRVLVLDVGGVEGVVAAVEEGGGKELVGAGAGDDVGHPALGPAVLGLVAGGDDLELLDRVLGVADEGTAVQGIVVVRAVHEEGEPGRALAEDRDLVEVAPLVPPGHGGGAGHELDEVDELAPVEGQVFDRLLRDAGRCLRLARVHERELRHHLHRLFDAGRPQREVDAGRLVERHFHGPRDRAAEVLHANLDVVAAGGQERHPVGSGGDAGGGAAPRGEAAAAHGDGRAGDDGAALVAHRADDGARDLGPRRAREQDDREKNCRPGKSLHQGIPRTPNRALVPHVPTAPSVDCGFILPVAPLSSSGAGRYSSSARTCAMHSSNRATSGGA